MNKNLKKDIFKALEKISIDQEQEQDIDTKFNNILDISNLVKLIDDYEEFEPQLRDMLNKKAREKKWSRKNNEPR